MLRRTPVASPYHASEVPIGDMASHVGCVVALPVIRHVRSGSLAEVAALWRDVCFALENGHWTVIPGGPFSAKRGLLYCYQQPSQSKKRHLRPRI